MLTIHPLLSSSGFQRGQYGPNVYLVVGQGKAALIDTGYAEDVERRLEQMKDHFYLSYIVITHCHVDHVGGVARFQEALGGEVVVHRAERDSPLLPDRVDGWLEDGAVLDLGGGQLQVLHTPGHSPGHICLYLPQEKALFSGDHVLGMGTTAISPPRGDMAQYLQSLRRLLEYPVECLYPGHGPVVTQPRRKVEELIEHRLARENQILKLLSQGRGRVEELFQDIYSELEPRLEVWARGQILAHLIKLEAEGRVSHGSKDGVPVYKVVQG